MGMTTSDVQACSSEPEEEKRKGAQAYQREETVVLASATREDKSQLFFPLQTVTSVN